VLVQTSFARSRNRALRTMLRICLMAAGSAMPAACTCHGAPYIVSAGGEDNFRGPPKPVTPSAQLMATRWATTYPKGRFRRFDEDGGNLLFLTSLLLPSRKICSARLEIHMRRLANKGLSYEFNDFLLIGFAPFGQSGDRKQLFRTAVWIGDPPGLMAKTAQIPLPAIELNRFILLTPAPHYLDIMVHNDTTVDYVKLILRFE
jgi:hypothetical protein